MPTQANYTGLAFSRSYIPLPSVFAVSPPLCAFNFVARVRNTDLGRSQCANNDPGVGRASHMNLSENKQVAIGYWTQMLSPAELSLNDNVIDKHQ